MRDPDERIGTLFSMLDGDKVDYTYMVRRMRAMYNHRAEGRTGVTCSFLVSVSIKLSCAQEEGERWHD